MIVVEEDKNKKVSMVGGYFELALHRILIRNAERKYGKKEK